MTMFLSFIPAKSAYAEEVTIPQAYSTWAFEDLVVGDTYGIYPQSWYFNGMQNPITNAELRVLLAGLRHKLLNTGCVIDYNANAKLNIKDKMTVKEVLEVFYTLISSYEFSGNIGIVSGESAADFMAKSGVFTGNEGELSLKDRCSVEQACVIATRLVTFIYDKLDAASKGFLWEINHGGNKVYLLGSIHLANYDIYPFSNTMINAFKEADVLGVEVDVLNNLLDVNMLLFQYGTYSDGTTLKDHVSAETYEKTVKVAANYGYTEEMISVFKPWAIFTMFSAVSSTSTGTIEEAATASSLGIDMKFLVDAYLFGKPIVELEGYDVQLRMLDSFSDKLAEYLLASTMDAILSLSEGYNTGGTETVELMLDYWHKGDVEGFMKDVAPVLLTSEILDTTELSDEDKDLIALFEEYYTKLFKERDKNMAEKIDGFLKGEGSKTYFVVVGSGHYISDYSVIDILKEKGYEVNQIK